MTKFIKQHDTWSCLACVAAMAAGKELQDVIDFVGHDGSDYEEKSKHPENRKGFDVREILSFLLSNDLWMGVVVVFKPNAPGEDLDPNHYEIVEISHNLNQPSMFVVESENFKGHCLYCDGKTVFDPHSGEVRLSDYKVTEWWPINRFVDR